MCLKHKYSHYIHHRPNPNLPKELERFIVTTHVLRNCKARGKTSNVISNINLEKLRRGSQGLYDPLLVRPQVRPLGYNGYIFT